MEKETAKIACLEVVDGLKCILEAQLGQRSREGCVPIVKAPVHRFCDIAKKTEKRFKKKDPRYEISRFLGTHPRQRKKMGVVCSFQTKFPNCDRAAEISDKAGVPIVTALALERISLKEWHEADDSCKKEVGDAIRVRPVEETEKFDKILTSFETMRDWMHVSGYATPDYVWAVPQNLRRKTKELFEYLSSEKVTSARDLEEKKREIQSW